MRLRRPARIQLFLAGPLFQPENVSCGVYLALVLLWLLILAAAVLFCKISKPAGLLLIPYLLWVAFAGYLNFAVYLLN